MSTEILMPALSPTMEEGKLAKWHVKEGDRVSSGDIIAEIETDKATMEVEAVDEGVVSRLLVAEGTEGVKVNAPIAILQGDDEPAAKKPTAQTALAASVPAPKAPAAPAPVTVASAQPEIAPGTAMHTITVREALREAMAEEMRRDPTVFLMGEEVAQYQG